MFEEVVSFFKFWGLFVEFFILDVILDVFIVVVVFYVLFIYGCFDVLINNVGIFEYVFDNIFDIFFC